MIWFVSEVANGARLLAQNNTLSREEAPNSNCCNKLFIFRHKSNNILGKQVTEEKHKR